MKRVFITTACLLLFPCARAIAQDSPETLAVKLGSRVFAEREAAAQGLEQLGTAALPGSPASFAPAGLETERPSIVVRERMGYRMRQESVVQATPIRLQYRD